MQIQDIIRQLEYLAPPALQEDYDNAGLITGHPSMECTGVLLSLDATEEVIIEAIEKKCNMVVSHHPIVFRGLKKINGKNYVERAIILAIKNDIALYAIHTNLDNVFHGVNGKMADKLGLLNRKILSPKTGLLEKLAVFVPVAHQEALMNALFAAGAGNISAYSECSFSVSGEGTFKGSAASNPFVGEKGERHMEPESKIEVIMPSWLRNAVLQAMKANHPYEEVAYDIYPLQNAHLQTGSGMIGELPAPESEEAFLARLTATFKTLVVRHTATTGRKIKKVALCGGAGSFMIQAAAGAGADVYVTSDLKYHEFFDADGRLLLADIGHYESEQFSIGLLFDFLQEKFPNFAVLKTGINSNPVRYFTK